MSFFTRPENKSVQSVSTPLRPRFRQVCSLFACWLELYVVPLCYSDKNICWNIIFCSANLSEIYLRWSVSFHYLCFLFQVLIAVPCVASATSTSRRWLITGKCIEETHSAPFVKRYMQELRIFVFIWGECTASPWRRCISWYLLGLATQVLCLRPASPSNVPCCGRWHLPLLWMIIVCPVTCKRSWHFHNGVWTESTM